MSFVTSLMCPVICQSGGRPFILKYTIIGIRSRYAEGMNGWWLAVTDKTKQKSNVILLRTIGGI